MATATTEELVEQIKALGRDVRQLGVLARQATAETVRDAGGSVREFLGDEGQLAESIRRHPLRSVLIAGGAGLILSWLLRFK